MLNLALLCSWTALVASLSQHSSPRSPNDRTQIDNVLQSRHTPAKLCADPVPLKKRDQSNTLKHAHHLGEGKKVNQNNKLGHTHTPPSSAEDKNVNQKNKQGDTHTHTQPSTKSTTGASAQTQSAPAGSCVVTDMASHKQCQGKSHVAVGDMTVPASTTLAFNMATGATLTIFGTIKFAYAKSKGPQVLISGQNVKVGGNGVIDGGGQQYWANKKDDGTKPDCLWLHDLHNSEVRDITIKNTPIQAVSILARYLNIINVKVDNSAGEQFGAQNTDAFDIGRSEHINIIGGKITTQDDAVVVNDGKHISITGVVAQGTHGFSISVSRGTVENVTVHDCTVNGGMYGVRLKTSKFGGAGSVKGVLWQNNRFHDIKVAAVAILQNYYDGRASGTPGNGVTIQGVNAIGNTGSSDDKALQIVCAACVHFNISHAGITGAVEVSGISIPGKSQR